MDFCRLRLCLLFLLACPPSEGLTNTLHISSLRNSPITSTSLENSKDQDPRKFSPASLAIHEGARVRRILQQRSSRGKPAGLNDAESSAGKTKVSKKLSSDAEKRTLPSIATVKRKSKTAVSSKNQRGNKGLSIPYETTLEGLRIYFNMNSNLVFPRRFVVEEDQGYPKELHGIDIAGTVYDMNWWNRHVKQRPDRVAELTALGFVWERLQPEWNLILEALITYRMSKGDLLVPTKFVVPFDDENWSRSTWGISLGNAVYRIRNRGDFLHGNTSLKRRNQLEALGFVWDVQEHLFDTFCSALRVYAKNEAKADANARLVALKVPSRFVIPKSEKWPRELWEYPLGSKCTAVRQKELYVKGDPSRLKTLSEIGFHIGGNDSLSWLEVVHAAAVYSQMHDRNLDVPLKFVVPEPPRKVSDDDHEPSVDGDPWPWPEYLWGLPLGQRLRDVRVKGYYLRGESADSRRRQLDALGFNWNPKRGRRKRQHIPASTTVDA